MKIYQNYVREETDTNQLNTDIEISTQLYIPELYYNYK
jgi:hypothetical protein